MPSVYRALNLKMLNSPRYLNEAAHDSFDRNAKVSTNVAFDNFTYTPSSALDREE